MTTIKARTKAEAVRAHAGHSSNQWKQFMKFTRQAAERLLINAPTATWIDIKDADQNLVLEAVNVQLQENEIPLVTLEILAWRMPRAMGELRKPSETSSRAESSQVMSPSNDTPVRTSYYDPARDT
ncbi:hypothetical protein BU26DRAFT_514195 [Trematosphaeria pertusa]|uniref:Uncharacterized protein n=1 Tax=Trematosphaeria pertusa TaxID=390896 RepID=A0A6A6IUH9_9PLEO|nr:uncharacterized protein BU26DRAFT_514195 [Trematosphaeria pertusa]KAF2254215.1 hypothetical protein BU26DRAFT_514195 [Trematosphaeria pertusa]